jgi:hypothetical protein
LGKFVEGLALKMLAYFYCHLVYFVVYLVCCIKKNMATLLNFRKMFRHHFTLYNNHLQKKLLCTWSTLSNPFFQS